MAEPPDARSIGTPLRILHLEDDPDFCQLLRDLLAKDGLASDLLVVGDLGALTAALEKTRFDIILADYSLPSCTGIQALEEAARRCPRTPFVIVSGTIGEEVAIEALKHGATDYVLKQWPEKLVPVIRRAIN
jgi:DNA-binding NtrC family response regulator